ncbi:MAG: prenyltransferase/squalene oxidase repeat-containing protein [Nitrososphaerota archaeon]|nr:hypothetical protein [Candidatus Bathyarchaeota archaeon]MDW8049280.1 prenyltransferase/squalene oxidase repeat-containing protein [Nitrososphaerota archaeon]
MVKTKNIMRYVLERQNKDGGYTFCRGGESNAQDTYYALKILEMLGAQPRNVQKTVRFLQRLQYDDGGFDSVKVAYYAIRSLLHLGHKPAKPLDRLHQSFDAIFAGLKNSHKYIDVEIVSEIENVHLAVELVDALDFPINAESVTKQILSLRNSDGSFGSKRHSRIASTYHVLKTLKILNYNMEFLGETISWVRGCELSSGGFAPSPEISTIYMEDIYYGVKALEVLNERPKYPKETLSLVASFQNPNGGFRRSIFLGISDLESTYQAISCIEAIVSIAEW